MTENKMTVAEYAKFAQLEGEDELIFYALVAKCILEYEGVERFLANIFGNLVDEPHSRARAIYDSVFGLDAKIRLIQAAAVDRPPPFKTELGSLLKKVRTASDVRGKIAHARPLSIDGVVDTSEGPVQQTPRWVLYKFGKKTEVFTVDALLEEYRKMEDLFSSLNDLLVDASEKGWLRNPAG